jgi:hypothetical protein
MLQNKIDVSKGIIETISKNYLKPIIYWGGGKDSTVLLHIVREMGIKWPCMFHRDPYFPKKYIYVNWLIAEWDLICYDYPAYKCSVFWQNGTFEVVRHFYCGPQDMILCAMLYKPEEFIEGEYLCAYKDVYLQPKGSYHYAWDVGLQAHRMHESKPHSGHKPNGLRWVFKRIPNGTDFVQPLREWTNQDVFEYSNINNLPFNDRVYYVDNGEFLPLPDSTYNPDRRPACYECMLPSKDMAVFCPKFQSLTNNVFESLEKTVMPIDYANYQARPCLKEDR